MPKTKREKKNQLFQHKIGRREFILGASSVGLMATIAPGMLCNSARALVPKKGGTLRVATMYGSTSDSLDPAIINHSFTGFMAFSLRNPLVELNPDGTIKPELAESWQGSSDSKTWIFKLRKGVEFHNGKTVDSSDVVASINHHIKEDSKSAVKPMLKSVTEVKADGKYGFVIKIDQPNVDFPYIMSSYNLMILPAKDNSIDWRSGIGTGAYKLEKFVPGVSLYMKRNPNYWKQGRGNFEEVELITVHDASSRVNGLMTKKIDVIDGCDIKTVDMLGQKPGIRVDEKTGLGHYSIPMLTDKAPFDNNDVRTALKLAVDRKMLFKNIFRGHGEIGNDQPLRKGYRFFDPELPIREYDPDKAKYHLKKAGYDSIKVSLHTSEAAFPEAVDLAVLYKEHAAKAGITINVVRQPADGYWSNVWMKKPWCFSFWHGKPTEDYALAIAYSANAPWNETHWNHERFNNLLKQARSELDESKRRDMYGEMQRIVRDEGGAVIPYFHSFILGCNDNLQHGPMSPHMDLDGFRMAEKWWWKS